tara:strand:+ start:124975 stop:126282 length:1308 start_codon:yes stop_codon:yes gene_type:complete
MNKIPFPQTEVDQLIQISAKDAEAPVIRLDGLKIAYLMNQHPMTSVSFVRREMQGMEDAGAEVQRFSIRKWSEKSVDPADLAEVFITEFLLEKKLYILLDLVWCILMYPRKFARALALTVRIGWKADRALPFYLMYLAEACRLRRRTAKRETQWVHAHFGTNSATVAMLCRLLGGPRYSFTVHGPEEFDRPELLHLGTKIEHASLVVAISKYCRSQLYRWSRYEDWQKIRIVRCGINRTFASPAASPPPEAPELVCVARLAEQKGLPILVRAAGELKRRGRHFHLSLIGDGQMKEEIKNLIQQNNVSSEVTILGWRSEEFVRNTIENSRALVLPSFAEGLPVVLMEAFALERPVITTQIAGIGELVRHIQNGWLIPAGDLQSLVLAMEAVLDASPADLHAMGKHGAKAVRERHVAANEGRRLGRMISMELLDATA